MPQQSFNIDGIEFSVVCGVESFSTANGFIDYRQSDDLIGDDLVFIIENNPNAFAHFVYESGIFLPLFLKLKEKLPGIKILISNYPHRSYKKLYLDYNGIVAQDIIEELPKKNTCVFFSRPVSLSISNAFTLPYVSYLDKYVNLVRAHNINKDIEYLFCPRAKSENFSENDRAPDYSRIYKELEKHAFTVFDPKSIVQLENQISIFKRSKNIILDYGSSFFVNGMFCKDSNIICLDNIHHQESRLETMRLIYDRIISVNTVNFRNSSNVIL